VKEVDDDVVFLDTQAVEVLPHRVRQLVFALSPEFFAPCDCWGIDANASCLREHPLMVVTGKCGRRAQSVGSAVGMENISFESRPLKL